MPQTAGTTSVWLGLSGAFQPSGENLENTHHKGRSADEPLISDAGVKGNLYK